MTKSAVKHHSYRREAFKWKKVRENTTVTEEKRSNDEKRGKKPVIIDVERSSIEKGGKSEKDSARKSTWGKAI